MLITLSIILALVGVGCVYILHRNHKDALREKDLQIEEKSKELYVQTDELFRTQAQLGDEREKNKKLLSQKKSSETRLGQISEHLIPFLRNCPYDPKDLHFLGNPIDYVAFDFDEGSITFIEIKSGNSRTSKRQKTVKNIIKTGRVYYDEIRINEKGITVKGRDNGEKK